MLNVIRCIDQRFVFKNSGIACLALIFNLSYPRLTILHKHDIFFLCKYALFLRKVKYPM